MHRLRPEDWYRNPHEPVGSLPRPSWLQQAYAQYDAGGDHPLIG